MRLATTLFITEGDSASGSITKARDVQTQAIFSLRGKPLNCYGLTKKTVYENEEFNLLQHALSIEDGMDDLRYNRVVIATDADVDGMHIRLLMLTFSSSFSGIGAGQSLVHPGDAFVPGTRQAAALLLLLGNRKKSGHQKTARQTGNHPFQRFG
nr:toprim domain-containing protein [Haliscomenobacter sp.]